MGRLTTHVLNTATGLPAVGMKLILRKGNEEGGYTMLSDTVTNHDGRVDAPLLEGDAFTSGVYELTFFVGDYFQTEDAFLDEVPIRFTVDDATRHYHVPLLVTPYSYTTYRGS
ncbi:hydroxyisourate hydrolase [Salisediminibacterium selenitireducens]|uniref:5-hydroxyisourate hydrolase n=1 Tax=Bacillus selenitireducens (strain ATCC 700615 / DSM 15326 / MLS10) TaxID=439292 RepID=D6XY46_BACIE|nr:hydroxyisourate hydrolase [Salisediminibacterium selenitireducens]ADH98119.1 hydroxyisourate hydrolase [[Bacillus] selenitireducens MLS10]